MHIEDGGDENRLLRKALDARGRRLVQQRLAMAELIEGLEEENRLLAERCQNQANEMAALKSHIEGLSEALRTEHGEIERLRARLAELLGSRSIRLTAPLRAIVRLLRRVAR